MRTSTSGCSPVNPRRRGMSHSEAKPLVVVTVSCRATPAVRMRSVTSCSRSSSSVPALEQGNAQMLLERPDLPADGRLGDEQLLGRPREREVACRRLEALDQVQRGEIETSLLHYTHSCM